MRKPSPEHRRSKKTGIQENGRKNVLEKGASGLDLVGVWMGRGGLASGLVAGATAGGGCGAGFGE